MFRKRRNRKAFARAQAQAGEGEMVCGTVRADGEPVYFVMPKDTPDEKIQAEAFRHREGRPMTGLEEYIAERAASYRQAKAI